jgi:hypothetical protein
MRDQALIPESADPNRDVEPLRDEVDERVREEQFA